jgi:PII-like signaling protein
LEVSGFVKLEGEQTLLRVYLRNTDKHGWSSASETLVQRAFAEGLAGATILRGIYGLDVAGNLLDTRLWSIADHVPVIVEIVDNSSSIGAFLSSVR